MIRRPCSEQLHFVCHHLKQPFSGVWKARQMMTHLCSAAAGLCTGSKGLLRTTTHCLASQHALMQPTTSDTTSPTADRKLTGSGSGSSLHATSEQLPPTAPLQRKLSPSEMWRQAAGDIGVARYVLCRLSRQEAFPPSSVTVICA